MRTIMAGAKYSAMPGQEIDLPEADAMQLIKGGFADPVIKPAIVETAAVEVKETAVIKRKGKR